MTLSRPLAFLLGVALAGSAQAAELTIGRATEPSSIDPLFARTGNNQMTAEHMFDRLVVFDENLQVRPGIAASWRVLDPLTWEVKLRDGVSFHDGSPLSAEDVLFSLKRAAIVANSPAPFTGAVAAIASTEAPDPRTVIIRTKLPSPLLIEQAGLVFIVSKKAAETAQPSDFNLGKATIGTGPYTFVEYVPGERLVLERNPNYWGEKPAFDRVTQRFISGAGARVAALLAGQVDFIDEVPTADIETVKSRGFELFSVDTARIIYLALDASRDASPFVTDLDGKPLAKNPLKDRRVRQAISKLIDRNAIVTRLLAGSGAPAAQMVPPGLGGYDPRLDPGRPDVAGAKALLAEAGFPNGFGITVHTSADRFPRDSDVGQAIGQMLARGALKVNGVIAKPYAVYATEASKQEYSAFVFSFGATTSNALGGFINVLATYDAKAGRGAFNRTRYSNPTLDEKIAAASAEFDEGRRNALLQEAARIVAEDVALVPLFFQKLHWAGRKGLTYVAGKDESTLATRVGIAP